MKTTDFSFDLPEELIAQHPTEQRGASRLLVLDRSDASLDHRMVADLPEILSPETVMVFNDSRVRKARLYGTTERGRTQEFLLTRPLTDTPDTDAPDTGAAGRRAVGPQGAPRRDPRAGQLWEAMTRKPARLAEGSRVSFPGERSAQVRGHNGMFVHLNFAEPVTEAYFAEHGHVPLPPYIDREDAPEDEDRYQTVYAREPGSVAAPTAGLHFTPEILDALRDAGVQIEWVRLHVGIGTFLPVRTENVDEHEMHEEECELTPEVAERLNAARASGKKLLAVGTTSVRTLESAWNRDRQRLEPFRGATNLFIRPGYEYGAVDMLFTNFHTPRSTLLMLVSAFAGRETVLAAYRAAVRERYRFFSYGDAMLIR